MNKHTFDRIKSYLSYMYIALTQILMKFSLWSARLLFFLKLSNAWDRSKSLALCDVVSNILLLISPLLSFFPLQPIIFLQWLPIDKKKTVSIPFNHWMRWESARYSNWFVIILYQISIVAFTPVIIFFHCCWSITNHYWCLSAIKCVEVQDCCIFSN